MDAYVIKLRRIISDNMLPVDIYGGLLGPSKVPLFFYFDSYMIDTYK